MTRCWQPLLISLLPLVNKCCRDAHRCSWSCGNPLALGAALCLLWPCCSPCCELDGQWAPTNWQKCARSSTEGKTKEWVKERLAGEGGGRLTLHKLRSHQHKKYQLAFVAAKPRSKTDCTRPTSSKETQVTLLPNLWEVGDQMGTCISTVFTKAGRQMMKVLKGHKSACLTAGILIQGHPLSPDGSLEL